MQAQEAARIFHDWASIEGMLPEGPVTSVQITNAEKALISPVTDLGKQVLRTKQILSVGFNEAASEIVVFTKRAAPTTKPNVTKLPYRRRSKMFRSCIDKECRTLSAQIRCHFQDQPRHVCLVARRIFPIRSAEILLSVTTCRRKLTQGRGLGSV